MPIKVTVSGLQQAQADIKKALGKLMTDNFVTVGIHESEGDHENSDLTNAKLGAILHFGADIDHPGGTSYGYATKEAAERGEVRFLKTGAGHAVLGVTKPHKIKIPPRPWLDVGVEAGENEYADIIETGIEAGESSEVVLERVGVVAAAKAREYMIDLKTPPNAPSTIRQKKGKSNPLINTGALMQSVTSKVTTKKPAEEGV